MAVRDKATIKSYFVKGAKPTQQQYIDLVDSYQDTGSSDAFTPIGQALVNASTQASARSAIGIDFVTTAQAVAGAIATGGMNPVLVKNQIQGFGYTTGTFSTTAAAVSGQSATSYMNPVLTRNAIEAYAPTGIYANTGYALARYYLGGVASLNGTPVTVVANRLYFYPFFVGSNQTFNRVGLYVQTNVAGNARIGLYNGLDGIPTTLISDFGTVSTATIGAKEITISQSLTPGLYFVAVVFDATPAVFAMTDVNLSMLNHQVGMTGIGTNQEVSFYRSFVYAALPTPFGGTVVYDTPASPGIWMREV